MANGRRGKPLVVTYNKRGSDVVALDRAAHVVRGNPLGTSWFRSAVYIDVLDPDGRLLMRSPRPV